MQLKDIQIVLCRPSESGNIGAVCRAMKNMGMQSLRIVSPETELQEDVIIARSVHAQDVWNDVRFFNSLEDAIADCSVVIGTSRRLGKLRKNITLTPNETADFLKDYSGNNAALVFGNERTGLENTELELCNMTSYIPADNVFPSLNLSHSVQIYCYELYTAMSDFKTERGKWESVPRDAIDSLTNSICDSLESLGFYTHTPRDKHREFFCDIFSRAAITESETKYIKDIFSKAARLSENNLNA
ncbi:MAG: RNA methyltransferase, partial [Bacteroidales bacterium]|nr:RNA methyltransferase [Bacteroidales bacterium]